MAALMAGDADARQAIDWTARYSLELCLLAWLIYEANQGLLAV